MNSFMSSLSPSSAPMPSAPPMSTTSSMPSFLPTSVAPLFSSGMSSFSGIPGSYNSLKNLGQMPGEISSKLKITSWLLFVVSLLFAIIFS